MNTNNLGVSGSGVGVTSNEPYGHHHLTHSHLLPLHHSQHPSTIYCSSSNPYTELFSPFSTDFVTPHDTGTNTGVPTDYLTLQNSLDYVVSHHQQQQQHLHQITTSSNGERTSSSIATGINGSDLSPPHSFATSSGYSSSADYYNASMLNPKMGPNNANTSTTNTNNNRNTPTTNTSGHSPYDGTSTATTSASPQSTGYVTATVKQETMMPTSFVIDPHSSYGTD